jgi:hypothetical protein
LVELKKRHKREREKEKNSVKFLFLFSSSYVRSEWLENIIISSNDNASGAITTTRTVREKEREK